MENDCLLASFVDDNFFEPGQFSHSKRRTEEPPILQHRNSVVPVLRFYLPNLFNKYCDKRRYAALSMALWYPARISMLIAT
jgi:hypothetical protein